MLGLIAGIGASISWTIACFLWKSETNKISPKRINFLKTFIALLFFSPFLFYPEISLNREDFFLLLFSGLIGIGIGDSFYITSLKKIGTRKTLSIESLSTLMANFIGFLVLNESPSLQMILGSSIVTISLILIIYQDRSINKYNENNSKNGVIFAFASIFCAVIGGSLSRYILVKYNINPLNTTAIRLVGGFIFLIIINDISKDLFLIESSKRRQLNIFISSLLGTNLGIYLQQVVFKTLPIGIGWTILSTSPIFSLFFAKKEKDNINVNSILLTFTAFLGVVITFL